MRIAEQNPELATMQKDFRETWVSQLGTLGGGNHFIELCLDEAQNVWVMLHSGSRGIGNVIGRYFIERARREMEKQRHAPARPRPRLARRRLAARSTITSRRCTGRRTTRSRTGAR